MITIKSCACPLRDLQKELNSGAGREEMLLLLLLFLLLFVFVVAVVDTTIVAIVFCQ